MKKLQIIGNLGGDAELKQVRDQTVIEFSVAETIKNKNGDEVTTWVRCAYWREAGQSTAVAQYLKKGGKVYVEGSPRVRAYINNRNEVVGSLEMVVERIELLGEARPSAAAPVEAAPADPAPAPKTAAQASADNALPF